MKPALDKPVDSMTNPVVASGRAWSRFWFSPADPTLLGLIRICCGLVTLYVHLAYTVDLQEFFGANAWIDAPTIEKFRHEIPWQARPWDWHEEFPRPEVGSEKKKPITADELEYMWQWGGINPHQAFKGYIAWSIWYHVADPTWMWIIHIAILVIMFLFTIGFCTGITSVLTWLAAVSYIQRSPTTLFGQDTMMNILLLYLMIAPSGAALSVDRLIGRYWATWRALRAHRPPPLLLQPAPGVSANLALRLLQVNLCIIYLASGLSKLLGNSWWNGTAIWWTLANYEFSPLAFGPYAAFLRLLCQPQCRWLWELLITGGVAFTFVVEIGFPFLVWNRRLRWPMVIAAVLMHTGIALSMGLTTFSLMMIIMDLSFVPQETVHRLLRWLSGSRSQLRLRFNGRARGQVRAASVVHAVDVWDQVHLAEAGSPERALQPAESQAVHQGIQAATLARAKPPAADVKRLELIAPDGQVLTGYALFERLVRSLRLLWPLALWTWVPGVPQLGKALYAGATPTETWPVQDSGKRRKGEKVTH